MSKSNCLISYVLVLMLLSCGEGIKSDLEDSNSFYQVVITRDGCINIVKDNLIGSYALEPELSFTNDVDIFRSRFSGDYYFNNIEHSYNIYIYKNEDKINIPIFHSHYFEGSPGGALYAMEQILFGSAEIRDERTLQLTINIDDNLYETSLLKKSIEDTRLSPLLDLIVYPNTKILAQTYKIDKGYYYNHYLLYDSRKKKHLILDEDFKEIGYLNTEIELSEQFDSFYEEDWYIIYPS